MKKNYIIPTGICIVSIANIMGHYFPPFSLFTTFIYMSVIVGAVNYNLYEINFKLTVLYNFSLLLLNDIFIRKFAGGTHDSVGMAVCWLMFQIGFVISTIIMIALSLKKNIKNENVHFSNFNVVVIGAILIQIFYNFVNAEI